MLWAIGDIHGNIPTYESILEKIHHQDENAITFQVGDMGYGFKKVWQAKSGENDFFIPGNHDDNLICQKMKGYLGDFGIKTINDTKIFFIRGAESHDRKYRTEGVDWWLYEELTYQQFCDAINLYDEERPDIIISHDCPLTVRKRMFNLSDRPATVQALETIFEIHRPKIWAFGHHHCDKEENIYGTKFICLGEFQYKLLL